MSLAFLLFLWKKKGNIVNQNEKCFIHEIVICLYIFYADNDNFDLDIGNIFLCVQMETTTFRGFNRKNSRTRTDSNHWKYSRGHNSIRRCVASIKPDPIGFCPMRSSIDSTKLRAILFSRWTEIVLSNQTWHVWHYKQFFKIEIEIQKVQMSIAAKSIWNWLQFFQKNAKAESCRTCFLVCL